MKWPYLFYLIASNFGFDAKTSATLSCIAKYESSYRMTAQGGPNSNGSYDHGILQINDIWTRKGGICEFADPYSLYGSLMCAGIIINLQGYNAWYAYQKNKDECDNFDPATGAKMKGRRK